MSPRPDTVRRLLCAWPLAVALPAAAQPGAWPSRPLKILVGFPPGSTPDTAARLLADALARPLGQAVVVENRPGASGNIAADAVAKAADDHTLGVVINGNLSSAKLLNPRLPFDPARDLAPIALLATAPLVLVAQPTLPDGAAFVEAARRAGARWSYGSVGVGSIGHLGLEALKARANMPGAVHVPYPGNPAVLNALLAGQIEMALVPPGLALPQVRAGRLKAVGLAGGRSTLAPEVPPLREVGIAHEPLEVWTALVGPASLSTAARQRLAREVPAAVRDDEVRQRYFAAGWQVQGGSAEALRERVAAETATLGAIIRAQDLHAE